MKTQHKMKNCCQINKKNFWISIIFKIFTKIFLKDKNVNQSVNLSEIIKYRTRFYYSNWNNLLTIQIKNQPVLIQNEFIPNKNKFFLNKNEISDENIAEANAI